MGSGFNPGLDIPATFKMADYNNNNNNIIIIIIIIIII